MSRFLTIAVFSLVASFTAASAFAGEFIDEGLVPAEVFERQDGHVTDLNVFDRAGRERDMRDCRRRGNCYPPPRRPAPPPPRRPAPGYGYVCYAENEWREIFTGRDRVSARFAQTEALDSCYAYSRRCVALGCDRY